MVVLNVASVFLWFAKDPKAHGDWRKTYGDWRKDPEGSTWLTEALRRLTEAWRIRMGAGDNGDGGGGPRSGGSWAFAGAGVLVCHCAGVPVCMCAGVPVLAVVYQYTGVQHFRWFRYNFPSIVLCVCWNYPMISFSSPNVCLRPPLGFPNGFVMISYAFLTASCCLSMVPYVFLSVRMFVWFSCEFPSEFLWFPVVFL